MRFLTPLNREARTCAEKRNQASGHPVPADPTPGLSPSSNRDSALSAGPWERRPSSPGRQPVASAQTPHRPSGPRPLPPPSETFLATGPPRAPSAPWRLVSVGQ